MKRETIEAIISYLNQHSEPFKPIVLGRPSAGCGVFAVLGEDEGHSYLGGKRLTRQRLLFLCRSDSGGTALSSAERIRAAADGAVIDGVRLFGKSPSLLDRDGSHITYAAEITVVVAEEEE